MIFDFLKKFSACNIPKESNCKYTFSPSNNKMFSTKKYNVFVSALLSVICVITQVIKNAIYYLNSYSKNSSVIKYIDKITSFINTSSLFYAEARGEVFKLIRYPIHQNLSQKPYHNNINANLSRLFSSFPFQIALRSILTTYFYQKGRDDYSLLLAKSVP